MEDESSEDQRSNREPASAPYSADRERERRQGRGIWAESSCELDRRVWIFGRVEV